MLYRLRFRITTRTEPLYTNATEDILTILERKWYEDKLPYFTESQPEAKCEGQSEFAPVTILTHYQRPHPLVVKDPRTVIDID